MLFQMLGHYASVTKMPETKTINRVEAEHKTIQRYLAFYRNNNNKIVINKVFTTALDHEVSCCFCEKEHVSSSSVIVVSFNDALVSNLNLYFCSEQCKNLWLLREDDQIIPTSIP